MLANFKFQDEFPLFEATYAVIYEKAKIRGLAGLVVVC